MAHECFNASSSDKGNEAKGTHSKNWAYVPSAVIIDDVLHGEEGIGGTAEQQACFTDGALAAMGTSVAIGVGPAKGTDYVIALRSPNTADGKGIDHLFPVLVGVAESCGYVLDF